MNKNWLPGIASLLMLGLVAISFTSKKNTSAAGKIRTIVVDAGHGFKGTIGARHGSFGTEVSEDQISHEVAKRLVTILQKEMPEVKILESRPSVYFVENKA
ncbi:MAG: N-acetylmuramoyl-L-alanine amidase, partial [Lacibacter sp.]|nr:N-acetylmuramoyl-L-alanine amidase [Lacibacter sp.]